jgi:hypothetical protein
MTVASEDRLAHARIATDAAVRPDDCAFDDGFLVDLRLTPEHEYGPTRAPALISTPSSMKHGPSIVAPSSTRASGAIHVWAAAPANGGAHSDRP